jgi:hypothetical protein
MTCLWLHSLTPPTGASSSASLTLEALSWLLLLYAFSLAVWTGVKVLTGNWRAYLRSFGSSATVMGWIRRWRMTESDRVGRELVIRLKEVTQPPKGREKGFSRLFGNVCIAIIVLGVGLTVYDTHEIHVLRRQVRELTEAPPNTIIRRNIAVIKRTDAWAFDAWGFDHAAHTWERFMFNVCPGPLKLTPDIRAGATITLWQYQEDTEHRCMDISNRTHAAIGVEMDGHGVPILAAYAEPPTWRPE